jgi:type I restriction-modification system DNA methylase subunit
MNKAKAKDTIELLVKRFDSQIDDYKKSSYQETTTRIDFINPLFEALGWDINNKLGLLVKQRDVIHEDKIKIGGVTKAPDYCFTIEGIRKFFLEAKRPGINIKEHIDPAYQLRRYGWNAKMPVSILTDFEEFSVYDCAVMPLPNDRAVISRIKYFTYKDYLPEFDFLWDTFSKENVIAGSLDKYAVVNKSKKGTEGVDAEFLKSLNSWRDVLARNLVLRNNNINEDELNYAIQKIIDRIIFLRICEDRGIEPELQLFNSIGTNTYNKLKNIFNIADQKFNSGLFDFRKDVITGKLNVDDKALKTIIEEMYYPKSPYEFSVIPVEILGHSYEQYLGKVIKIDAKHKISIDEKPEVRKAGGVYYTPQYIVDYIVRNTVGKIIDGKTPDEITKIKIVDPACGSGSFLLGAYKYLLEWHIQYYNKAKIKNKAQYLTHDGRLTNEIKKKILTNNIFGVDIDTNAVEVTKLSLMLQVMEGETSVSIDHHSQLIQHRVLPSLDKNILSGNSLIDFDFYENKLDLEPGAEKKIKPFNWQNAFPDIFKQGGFDVVIGNPPYVYIQDKYLVSYFSSAYRNQDYQSDLYLIFLERYEHIIKNKGLLGVIVSNTWLQSLTMRKIRKYLINTYNWKMFLHLKDRVFKAIVDTHVLIFEKDLINDNIIQIDKLENQAITFSHSVFQNKLPKNGDLINIVSEDNKRELFEKIKNNTKPLSYFCDVFNGVKPFEKGKGKPPQTEITMKEKPFVKEKCPKPGDEWSPLLRGSLINRYINLWNNNSWILYGEWLAAPRNPKIFESGYSILVRQTSDRLIATRVESGYISRNNLHIIIPKNNLKSDCAFILGILNSKLLNSYYEFLNPEKGEALAEVKKMHVEMLPIPQNPAPETQNQLIKLVETMLQLNKDLQKVTLPEQKEQLKARIQYTDKKIDKLVYELYELTLEEIKIVEGE